MSPVTKNEETTLKRICSHIQKCQEAERFELRWYSCLHDMVLTVHCIVILILVNIGKPRKDLLQSTNSVHY